MNRDDFGSLEMTGMTKDYYESMGWLGLTGITRVDKRWLGMNKDDLDDCIWMAKDD